MSLLLAVPESIEVAASSLSDIGSMLGEAHALAAGSTVAIPSAACDEVSTVIAGLISGHGQQFQALNSQFAALHDQFTQTLRQTAGAYAGSEASNVATLLAGDSLSGSAPAAGITFDPSDVITIFHFAIANPVEFLIAIPVLQLLLTMIFLGYLTSRFPFLVNGF